MMAVRSLALVAIGMMVMASLGASASGSFPVDEEIYTWLASDNAEEVIENVCRTTAKSPASTEEGKLGGMPNPNPCDILAYEVGSTETHLHVRWTMATTEFGTTPTMPEILLTQVLVGTKDPGGKFPFCVRYGPDGDPAQDLDHSRCSTTPSSLQGELETAITRATPGYVEVAIPRDIVGTFLDNGTVIPGERIIIETGARSFAGVVEGDVIWREGDKIDIPNHFDNPYVFPGETKVEPERFLYNITGVPDPILFESSDPVHEVHTYNWSVDFEHFIVNHTLEIENGSVALTLKDPREIMKIDGVVEEKSDEELFEFVEMGDWTIEIVLDSFVGSFALAIREPVIEQAPPPDQTDQGTNNTTTGPATNNTTTEPDDRLDDDKRGLPAPGFILLAVTLLAFVSVLRRRR